MIIKYILRFERVKPPIDDMPGMPSRSYRDRAFEDRPFPSHLDIELEADEFVELLTHAVQMRQRREGRK